MFTVKQRERQVGSFAEYIYDVFRDGQKVGEFSHTYRGDEPMLRIGNGSWVATDNILIDDKPPPHMVSEKGSRILAAALAAA